jgi:hypothetical protein
MELTASEYYSNEIEDDIDAGIVGGNITPIEPEIITSEIEGEVFIKPKKTYTYTYTGTGDAQWIIDSKLPIEKKIDGKTITLSWTSTYRGEFVLAYGDVQKTIIVESLF